ncbi:hypothetical protein M9H77_22719 [Catharanthus roseus]|uniref:Uncharacterized protein n=1 Tax=Catharanthus roseus TaxID=4058 RepID=A0ACC0AS03_CATRO|nr:hypothetical protein M9H77_22719 [Catharanthus roseus]
METLNLQGRRRKLKNPNFSLFRIFQYIKPVKFSTSSSDRTLPLTVGNSFDFESTKPSKLASLDSSISTLDYRKVLDPPKSSPSSSSTCQVKLWSIFSKNTAIHLFRNYSSSTKNSKRTFVEHIEGIEYQRKI